VAEGGGLPVQAGGPPPRRRLAGGVGPPPPRAPRAATSPASMHPYGRRRARPLISLATPGRSWLGEQFVGLQGIFFGSRGLRETTEHCESSAWVLTIV
jgi:hypothetical protein